MIPTLSPYRRILAVIAGGFCGTILRVFVSNLVQSLVGKGWPYDILFINLTGAFMLSFVTTLADATLFVGPTRRIFINVGLLGAYTTFSSLTLGDVMLIAQGRWLSALTYIVISGIGGIVAVIVGDLLGRICVRRVHKLNQNTTTHHLTSSSVDETTTYDQIGTKP